jgi:hypothetical protein
VQLQQWRLASWRGEKISLPSSVPAGSPALAPQSFSMEQYRRESRVKGNFKIKSETTGYVQEGDDYAWEF